MFEIPDIFLGLTVDAGSEPTYAEKIRVPPLGIRYATRGCVSIIYFNSQSSCVQLACKDCYLTKEHAK